MIKFDLLRKSKKFDVVTMGLVVGDLIGKPVDEMPGRGKLVMIDDAQLHTGGNVCNTGIALARLGIDTGAVAMIGEGGRDGLGDFIVNALANNGVDTDGVIHREGIHSSATMVMVSSDGERSFIHYPGGHGALSFWDITDDIYKYITQGRILQVGYFGILPKLQSNMGRFLGEVKRRDPSMIISLETAGDTRPMETERVRKQLLPR